MRRCRFRFTIRLIMVLVAIIAVALWLSLDAWVIIMPALTLAALGVAVLGARFHHGHIRAFCVGAAIAGWAYFFYFTSPTLARGAAQPYRRIAHSLVTIPVAAAGGSAVSLCYRRIEPASLVRDHRGELDSAVRDPISVPLEGPGRG
jgi:hypothetical protein